MKTNNQLVVVKANDLIQQFEYNLNEAEWDLFDYMIAQIRAPFALTEEEKLEYVKYNKKLPVYDKEFNEVNFYIKDYFKEVYSRTSIGGTQYQQLINTIDSLASKKTKPVVLTSGKYKGYETTLSLISKRYVDKEKGHVILKLDDDLKPYLIEIKRKEGKYTTYFHKYKSRLSSKYSRRLYELLKSNQHLKGGYYPSGVDGLPVEDFKALLNIPSSYRFNNIKERILEDAISDINANTDIKVSYKARKKGKKVVGISFKIEEQKDPLKIVVDVECKEIIEKDDVFNQLLTFLGGVVTSDFETLKALILKQVRLTTKGKVTSALIEEKTKKYIDQKIKIIKILNVDDKDKYDKIKELVLLDIQLLEEESKVSENNATVESIDEENEEQLTPIENEFLQFLEIKTVDVAQEIMNLVDTFILDKYSILDQQYKNAYIKEKIYNVKNAKTKVNNKVAYAKAIIQADINNLVKLKGISQENEKIIQEWPETEQSELSNEEYEELKNQMEDWGNE